MMNLNLRGATSALASATVVAIMVSGCATVPKAPPGSMEVRSKLSRLESDTSLASRIPVALEQAVAAVKLAETPQSDAELAAHRVYLADRLVDTARATAEVRLTESQRDAIRQQSEAGRLAARTREADAARAAAAAAQNEATLARNDAAAARSAAAIAAETARGESEAARLAAQTARNEAEGARAAAALAAQTAQANAAAAAATAAAASEARRVELAEQVALLQARTTERGIVLTLGDVLFATGSASLKPGAIGNLDRLVTFLSRYADRTALVEGHTDDVGSNETNETLSLRRAESVRGYLTSRGISPMRLASFGKGETQPVAGNDSSEGRQQNRRVEVVIENERPPATVTR
jgi:outer membrane protein OmpA-like peptidoglycan-associated protein